jgi:hypothetical protein
MIRFKQERVSWTSTWVVAARAATAGSKHGAEGGAAGFGSVRHTAKKNGVALAYSSYHYLLREIR